MVGAVGGMTGLTCLHMKSCSELECIFHTTSDYEVDPLIPKLEELVLSGLKSLKELCRGPPLQVVCVFEKLEILHIKDCLQLHNIFPWQCNLQNLTILTIQQCPQLHNIFPWDCNLQNLTILKIDCCTSGEALFSMAVAQSLQRLEELEIAHCDELKHIIGSGREHGSNTGNKIVMAPPLRSSHIVMPRLKELCISECRKFESIFPICCVEGLAALKMIQIGNAPALEYVFGQCDHQYHSSHQHQKQNMHPCLKYLVLSNLENLIGISSENNHAKCLSSTMLSVVDCPKLSASWIATMAGSGQREEVVRIEDLTLRDFSGLSLISRVGSPPEQILSLQCLRCLVVGECENLRALFSMEAHRSLPELISLQIYNCQGLEQITVEDEELVQLSNAEVCFPKLTMIKVYNCNKLKSLFPVAMFKMFPQLSNLDISWATQLEVVFRHGSGDDTINESEIVLPNLTRIELCGLPNFVDICRGFKLQAVKLHTLDIDKCPKTAPSLREIQVQLEESEGDD